jgi:hypothetical protein
VGLVFLVNRGCSLYTYKFWAVRARTATFDPRAPRQRPKPHAFPMPRQKKKKPSIAEDDDTASTDTRKGKEKESNSKWLRPLHMFGGGEKEGRKAPTKGQDIPITRLDEPLRLNLPTHSKSNSSDPIQAERRVEYATPDNGTAPASATEHEPKASIGKSEVKRSFPDIMSSSTSASTPQWMTYPIDDDEIENSQHKTKQRLAAEEQFRTAVTALQNLMLQIAGKENPKFIIDMLNFEELDDFDKNITEISTAIDNFMDKRTELRGQQSQVKKIAERWYSVCFPFVKGGLSVASVCSKITTNLRFVRNLYQVLIRSL